MTTKERLRARLEAIPAETVIPTATALARELGVTRERVRQMLNELERDGLPTVRYAVTCHRCGSRVLGMRRQETTDRARSFGWGKRHIPTARGHTHAWTCPDCVSALDRERSKRFFERDEFPRPGTLDRRLLEHMRQGGEYRPTELSRMLGTPQSNISRAKARLIAAGKWPGPIGRSVPGAPYVLQEYANTPARKAARARYHSKNRAQRRASA